MFVSFKHFTFLLCERRGTGRTGLGRRRENLFQVVGWPSGTAKACVEEARTLTCVSLTRWSTSGHFIGTSFFYQLFANPTTDYIVPEFGL